ncbi:hypothetical protein Ctob_000677 [Chrysochromulina tobinii]|uniref:Uncharacterized protein n=1 Tax=Chrysochromulina tobinii TaxID=1460289 RepID=A0A0M0J5Z1_9EUKA|nr:hypothetical protein Ctob_000677 [Chrysochromulina tobinii]|eukprot:KOO22014.1 hypothetical protein Ctob_000677 [Chrysochromulina sp. CCMP291]
MPMLLRSVESVYFESMTNEDAKNKMHREKVHADELNRRLREDVEKLTLQLAQEKQRRQADQSLHGDLEHNAQLMEEIVEKQKEVSAWHDEDHAILKDVHESSGCHRDVLARLTREVGRLKELQQDRTRLKKLVTTLQGRVKQLKAKLAEAEAHHKQRETELRAEVAATHDQLRAASAEAERVASAQLEALRVEHDVSAAAAAATHESHGTAMIAAIAAELTAAEGALHAKIVEVRRVSSESVDLVTQLKHEAAQTLADAQAHAKAEHETLRQEKEALAVELSVLQQRQNELLAQRAAAAHAHDEQSALLTEQVQSMRAEVSAKGAAIDSAAAELDALRSQSAQQTLSDSRAATQREWDAVQQEHKSRAALLEATTTRVEALEAADAELRAQAEVEARGRAEERRELEAAHQAALHRLEKQLRATQDELEQVNAQHRATQDELEQAHAATQAAQAVAQEAHAEATAQRTGTTQPSQAAPPTAAPMHAKMAEGAALPPLPPLGAPTMAPNYLPAVQATPLALAAALPAVLPDKENAREPPADMVPVRPTGKTTPSCKPPPLVKLAPPAVVDKPPAPKSSAAKPPAPASAKSLSAPAVVPGRSQSAPMAAPPAAKRPPERELEAEEVASKDQKRSRSLGGGGSGSEGATFNRRKSGSGSSMIKNMAASAAAASFDLFDF